MLRVTMLDVSNRTNQGISLYCCLDRLNLYRAPSKKKLPVCLSRIYQSMTAMRQKVSAR